MADQRPADDRSRLREPGVSHPWSDGLVDVGDRRGAHPDDADRPAVLERARQAGVRAMLVVGFDLESSRAAAALAAEDGLYAAVGAAGVGPGDEVIVSPYTMSASATAALIYGGIPVFADIDPEIFCISPESIEKCITPSTKAIIVVDIFGHPADMDEIMAIAREHDLVVIEDAAQAPGATYKGRFAGTLADMGVYSLNYHKTIQTGEGGVAVTLEVLNQYRIPADSRVLQGVRHVVDDGDSGQAPEHREDPHVDDEIVIAEGRASLGQPDLRRGPGGAAAPTLARDIRIPPSISWWISI